MPNRSLAVTAPSAVATSDSYKAIKQALIKQEPAVTFNIKEISPKNIENVIEQILQETPEILYYQSAIIWSNGKLELQYAVTKTVATQHQQAIASKADKIVSTIKRTAKTDFDKVKAVHDYLVLNTAYDTRNIVPASSYSAYGALIKEVAVCDGYTKAAQLLLNKLGITNRYVAGIADGIPHSWNLVKVNNVYYFMDTTWDDPIPNQPGRVNYEYFLTTTAKLKQDHTWNESQWPKAIDTHYQYFADMENVLQVGQTYYYSSRADDNRIYKISLDGKNKTKISSLRAPYFIIYGQEIYFSNFSNNGYLYKMTLTGKNAKKLNSIYSIHLKLVKNQLYYINAETNRQYVLTLSTK